MKKNIINFFIYILILIQTNQVNIEVASVEELHKALSKAKAGHIIQVSPGIYDYSQYERSSKFYGTADGNKNSPIIITAKDPNNPPILTGPNLEHNYVLHITGDYWIIENIKIAYSQKGIVLDNSNYSIIRNVEVYSTGAEAIAIRDGSSNCLVQKCYIHNTGLVTPGYGEGIYIGSSESTTGYEYKCNNNIIEGCIFRDIAAEPIDIKEYTTGQEVFGCIFYGMEFLEKIMLGVLLILLVMIVIYMIMSDLEIKIKKWLQLLKYIELLKDGEMDTNS